MRDRLDELGTADVVVITFTRPRNLAGFRSRFVAPLTVLADEDRHVYRAYSLGRGPWWRVYGWATIRRYIQLVRAGSRMQRLHEDTLQLGGDFVVGPDGRLVYVFRSTGPSDRPTVDELITAVREAARS